MSEQPLPATPEPIVELGITRVLLFEDEIRFCNRDGSTERSISLSSIDLVGAKRMVDRTGLAFLFIGAFFLSLAFYSTALLLRVPMFLIAFFFLFFGIISVRPTHLVLFNGG